MSVIYRRDCLDTLRAAGVERLNRCLGTGTGKSITTLVAPKPDHPPTQPGFHDGVGRWADWLSPARFGPEATVDSWTLTVRAGAPCGAGLTGGAVRTTRHCRGGCDFLAGKSGRDPAHGCRRHWCRSPPGGAGIVGGALVTGGRTLTYRGGVVISAFPSERKRGAGEVCWVQTTAEGTGAPICWRFSSHAGPSPQRG